MHIPDDKYYNDPEIKDERIDFILNQGKDALKTTIEINAALEDKAYKLIPIMVGLISIIISSFFVILFDTTANLHRPSILVALPVLATCILVAIRMAHKVFAPTEYHFLGNLPQNMTTDECFNVSDKQLKWLEIDHYNRYTLHNRKLNKDKASNVRKAYSIAEYAFFIAAAVLGFIELISVILSGLCHHF